MLTVCVREYSFSNPNMAVSIFQKCDQAPSGDDLGEDRPVETYTANMETRNFIVTGEDICHYVNVSVMEGFDTHDTHATHIGKPPHL